VAFHVSRATFRRILLNFAWAYGYNVVGGNNRTFSKTASHTFLQHIAHWLRSSGKLPRCSLIMNAEWDRHECSEEVNNLLSNKGVHGS
jgi:hypothetical protein